VGKKRISLPNKYYGFKDCTVEDFTRTSFENKLANTIFNVWKESRLCIDDPKGELYLQGDKNSQHS